MLDRGLAEHKLRQPRVAQQREHGSNLLRLCRAAKGRLSVLDKELAEQKKRQSGLTQQWEAERGDMLRLQSTKEEIDR